MQALRNYGCIAAVLLSIATVAISSAEAYNAIDVVIDDGINPVYSNTFLFRSPPFTPGGGGMINATINTITTPFGADYQLTYLFDPAGHHLGIGFTGTAGANDTKFSITATSPTFATLTNPFLRTTGTLNGLDYSAMTSGLITGQFPPFPLPGNSLRTSYGLSNPTDNIFATVINDSGFIPLAGNPLEGITNSVDTGYSSITGSVGVARTQWYFALKANDTANGTSEFLVPEPSTLTLLAVGSVAFLA